MSEQIRTYKDQLMTTVENDGAKHAQKAWKHYLRKNKFKVSEKQFKDEVANAWIAGEFSCAERILRSIENDPELNTRDLIRGEIHLFIADIYQILTRRGLFAEKLTVDQLLEFLMDGGKWSTEEVQRQRAELMANAKPTGEIQ